MRHIASASAPALGPGLRATPPLERVLVELTRALPRHGDTFLEPSSLSAAQVAHFFAAELPAAAAGPREAAYDRLLQAAAEHRHNLPHVAAIERHLQVGAGARLDGLRDALAVAPQAHELAHVAHQLRRLSQLDLPPDLAGRRRALEQAAAEHAGAANHGPGHGGVATAQLKQLELLRPLTRVRYPPRPGTAIATASAYSFVSGDGEVPVRGVLAPSEQQRGWLSRIKPLLLEDGREMVDRAVRVQVDGSTTDARIEPAAYARQLEAGRIAGSTVAPIASFYDRTGELHDVVPRYDGDLVDLLQAHGHASPHLGLGLGVATEVLERLARLHAAGWGHFDVKPDNVLWRRDGQFALTDFGDARPFAAPDAGQALGTVGFLAPELLHARQAPAPAADLFALGVTLGRLLAPAQLENVPLWLEISPHDLADPELREVVAAVVDEASAGYLAYQADRATGAPGGADAPAYEALRGALRDATDEEFASWVVDRLLHPDPAARGTAAGGLAELQARYPATHASRGGVSDLLRQAAHASPYAQRMDATYADMRRYRDGLLRGIRSPGPTPPPLPQGLKSP